MSQDRRALILAPSGTRSASSLHLYVSKKASSLIPVNGISGAMGLGLSKKKLSSLVGILAVSNATFTVDLACAMRSLQASAVIALVPTLGIASLGNGSDDLWVAGPMPGFVTSPRFHPVGQSGAGRTGEALCHLGQSWLRALCPGLRMPLLCSVSDLILHREGRRPAHGWTSVVRY